MRTSCGRAGSRSSSSTRPVSRSTTPRRSAPPTGTAGCGDPPSPGPRAPPDRGHRRAGWILCSRARIDGYRAAMDAAGVPVDPDLTSHGRVPRGGGHRRGPRPAAPPDRPTAIFTGNDLQALGVYQAAREARLHIPEDLSVVGFDDLPVARWVGPPLTTIRQPLFEMAVAAAELVLRPGRRGASRPRRGSSSRPSSWFARARPRRATNGRRPGGGTRECAQLIRSAISVAETSSVRFPIP